MKHEHEIKLKTIHDRSPLYGQAHTPKQNKTPKHTKSPGGRSWLREGQAREGRLDLESGAWAVPAVQEARAPGRQDMKRLRLGRQDVKRISQIIVLCLPHCEN